MIRVGVLGTANIAERRMIPAFLNHPQFEYVGVAIASREETDPGCSPESFSARWESRVQKARRFSDQFGGGITEGYTAMLRRKDIDAVYIPLPPALHFRWIKTALENSKHVIAEKPITTSLSDTRNLIAEAEKRNLAVIENYGFCYHSQTQWIQEVISSGKLGSLRLVRTAFGFPHRAEDDFRYIKHLGGGALLDCGGYTLKAASLFLDADAEVVFSQSVITPGHEVDIYGSAVVRDSRGRCAQLSYGMDNAYKCELEIWGSLGMITASRFFTAPAGFEAPVLLTCGNQKEEKRFSDDQFQRLIHVFASCVQDSENRKQVYSEILRQSALVESCGKHVRNENTGMD